MNSILTKAAILFGAMLATLLTVLAMKGLVHEESHQELGVVTLALADRHQAQDEWLKQSVLTCACVAEDMPVWLFPEANEGMGCNPRYIAISGRKGAKQCSFPIDDYRILPRRPYKQPAGLFRVDLD
ncbi:hypothetical protein PVT67_13355 [Gallaecimonas kandeliae]|uniref:hypothetical protein n=1 Tax=Gallaecimonas kandeliae TaxID=3029055 RepID=UPI0026496947|nr:hypothetical protein [Gallaecimonas kandeliae]WKE64649.1 hypothetical protein PVT67_13355 [Gallaecimonas kandeliae]